LIGIISVPFSYGIWYVFFHPAPGHSQGRLVEFMSVVIDFARW